MTRADPPSHGDGAVTGTDVADMVRSVIEDNVLHGARDRRRGRPSVGVARVLLVSRLSRLLLDFVAGGHPFPQPSPGARRSASSSSTLGPRSARAAPAPSTWRELPPRCVTTTSTAPRRRRGLLACRGGRELTPADLRSPAPYRLYRATVTEHSVLCPRPAGVPCADHGLTTTTEPEWISRRYDRRRRGRRPSGRCSSCPDGSRAGSEPVQLAGVLAHDLPPGLERERGHLLGDGLERRRVHARRVGEVGLEENVVLADRLDEVGQLVPVVLEPERRAYRLLRKYSDGIFFSCASSCGARPSRSRASRG